MIQALIAWFGLWWLFKQLRHWDDNNQFQRGLRAGKIELKPPPLPQTNNQELDVLVLRDALLQVERAKGAVVAVLKNDGVSDEQIQHIIDLIEGEKHFE